MPTFLFLASASVAAWSGLNAGATTDLSLLAGTSAVAALILMMRAEAGHDESHRDRGVDNRKGARHGGNGDGREDRASRGGLLSGRGPRGPAGKPPANRLVLIDGSNVLYWENGTPSLDTLKRVLKVVKGEGLVPLVGFDANVGQVIGDGWRDARAMARMLRLPVSQVSVAPKGTPADPLLIAEAMRLDAPIITNDRYREWLGTWPQIAAQGFLIRGGYHEGRLWLDLPEPEFMPQGFAMAA